MDFLELLKDKKPIIQAFLKTAMDKDRVAKGLRSLKASENQEFKIEKMLETIANQNLQISQLCTVLLCYAQGSSFESDIVEIMNKMGRGDEAVQQMYKNKLNGN